MYKVTLSRYQPGPKPVLSCPMRTLSRRPSLGHSNRNSSDLKWKQGLCQVHLCVKYNHFFCIFAVIHTHIHLHVRTHVNVHTHTQSSTIYIISIIIQYTLSTCIQHIHSICTSQLTLLTCNINNNDI